MSTIGSRLKEKYAKAIISIHIICLLLVSSILVFKRDRKVN